LLPIKQASVNTYLLSLGAGMLVGIVYSLLGVRSPAPPAVALLGLLGILSGEQLVPVAKRVLAGHSPANAISRAGGTQHLFGLLPGHNGASRDAE
jgi:XapX domain-containing protein